MVSLEFFIDITLSGFGGLVVCKWYPRSRVRSRPKPSDFSGMPSFGKEVKPFAPCRRFAACKRSLNGVKRRHFGKITGPFSPTVPPFAIRSARVNGDVEASGGESGNV
jgi:hypothetical protein